MASSWIALRDPRRTVDDMEVLRPGRAVVAGIAPPVQDVAPPPINSAGMACGFGGGRTVIDDVDLVEVVRREDDLIPNGVVTDSVHVHPITAADPAPAQVQVDQLRMFGDDSVVVLGRIVVLDQMVPG